MAAILNSAILNLAILDSAIIVFPLKLTHTCQDWFLPIAQKKTFTHSFWLNLMMAAILNSTMLDSDTGILDSDTFLSSLRFTPKLSPSTLTLTQTNSIWLTWRWQPSLNSAILNLAILDSATLVFPLKLTHTCQDWFPLFAQKKLHSFIQTQLDDGSHLEFYHVGLRKPSLIHSDSTWWWQPSWILPSWIHTPCSLLSDSLQNTLPPLWVWLKLN